MQAVPHLCELYPGICLTTEKNARINLSHGVSVVTLQFFAGRPANFGTANMLLPVPVAAQSKA